MHFLFFPEWVFLITKIFNLFAPRFFTPSFSSSLFYRANAMGFVCNIYNICSFLLFIFFFYSVSAVICPRSNEIYVRPESVSNSSLSSKTIHKQTRKRGRGKEVGWFVTSEPACRVCSRCLPNAVKVHVNYRINLVSTSALSACHVIKTFLSPSETSLQTEMPIISI